MLERFVSAQDKTYAEALAELKAGRKQGHWIWWIFPQMRGLGNSEYAVFYGIQDDAEADAYLRHPVLGVRYLVFVETVHRKLCRERLDPIVLMGSDIDVLKLRSSLGLFCGVAGDRPEFDCFRRQAQEILEVLGRQDDCPCG